MYGYYFGYVDGPTAYALFGDTYHGSDSEITLVTSSPIITPDGKWCLSRMQDPSAETIFWTIVFEGQVVSSIPRDIVVQVLRGHVDVEIARGA